MVLRAELELVPVVPARTLVVLGYDDVATAADAVPRIVEHEPIALEGADHFLVHDEQLKGMTARPVLGGVRRLAAPDAGEPAAGVRACPDVRGGPSTVGAVERRVRSGRKA